MKGVAILSVIAFAACAEGAMLRSKTGVAQEPDTACGKGFDNLVGGSQEYFKTARKLWNHPYHTADYDTFGAEFKCWFAKMATTKCGGLPSQADARKDDLTKKCLAHDTEFMPIWKMFSKEEVAWFKNEYPGEPIPENDSDVTTVSMSNAEPSSVVNYKEAMVTAKEVNKKELLCLTLFTIDDECVKWPHIRLGKQ